MIYAHLSESRLKQAVAKLDEPAPKPAVDGHFCGHCRSANSLTTRNHFA